MWSVYGYTSSQPRCKERTDEILAFVNTQIDLVPLPFIICGDFNAKVSQLPSWTAFAQRGAQDLAQIHQRLHGGIMPPTCHQATRPDSAIISKDLVPMVKTITVLQPTWFSAHAPVVFQIQLPGVALFRHHFSMPKSYMDFAPTIKDLEVAHKVIAEVNTEPSTLEEWGKAVEDTVDIWLQQTGHSIGIPTCLPKAYRGRCCERKLQQKPVISHLRHARQGDYEPPDEILSVNTKRKVTQHRRIESIFRRIKAEPNPQTKGGQYFQGMCQEWNCILQSKCYGPLFAKWLSDIPELGMPPWPLPTLAYIHEVLQHSRYHIDSAIACDRKVFQNKAKYAEKLDRQHMGSRNAFSRIRGTPRSPANVILNEVEFQIPAKWNHEHKIVELNHPNLVKLEASTPIFVDGHQGKICHFSPEKIVLHLENIPEILPDVVKVTQSNEICDPQDVADQLTKYWTTWWQNATNQIADDTSWEFDDTLTYLPQLPPIEIDFTVCQLKQAILRLKPNSARGFDGISVFELQTLPDALLAQLLKVFQNYRFGFPEWFMRARTFPLRKCDGTPQPHQTRPITVLSLLYRLWGSLICRQILNQWQLDLPNGITGMLPTRGSHLAAYAAQIGLEIDHFHGANTSGVTLDLRKCFNLISHQAGRRLLISMGIPPEYVQQWISSIRVLSRYWEIESSHFGPIHSNNGFPEGDVWSVVVMLAIGVHWISTIGEVVNHDIQCTAYADNWGWKSREPTTNVDITIATCDFLGPYGLQIDWNKTWCWGTSTTLAKQVQQLILKALPDCPIAILTHSRDLGFELQFSGAHRIGHRSNRYEEGFRRLERLDNLKVDLRTKEHILLSSVWPATLYGCEIFPPPGEILTRLTSQAANALVGKSKAMTPCLVLLLTGTTILDPTFQCIHMALRAAKTWLHQANQRDQHRFFHLTATATGRAADIKGPASALRYYLDILAWKCDKQGFLNVAPFLQIHLLQDSWQRIEAFLIQAWQQDLIVTRTHRTSQFGLPDVSRHDTIAILSKFDDASRRKLIREIAGAYQTTAQKLHWAESHPAQCRFCTHDDSKNHRLSECPAFAEIRAPYQRLLDELHEAGHSMIEFPVIHVHKDHLVQQHLQFREPRIIFPDMLTKHFEDNKQINGAIPNFYTDGSCFHPTHATTRYASFAIVLDLCRDNQERMNQIDLYNVTGSMPPTLILIAAGRVFGEQTINRAELMAITELIKQVPQAKVYTDSAYACTSVETCFDARNIADLARCNHLDLHVELLHNLKRQHQVIKIAAHQDISKLQGIEKYHALGNQLANDKAIETCSNYNKPW